ncbi:cobyric acid synthase [Paenibacillus ginsengihumi]|uniref:cobyric acid synthase n=1 Tax=Paenibacillus ginsengihumi TaxID=431596 RepID=UPI000476ED7C
MLERYGHGGDLWTAAEAFGRSREQFLDFSSNMNPLGPPEAAERILRERWRDIVHYPDPAVRELSRRIAARHGVPEACVLVGNGAAELIDLAVRVLKPAVTGLVRPSFGEYEEAVRKAGGAIYDIRALPQRHFVVSAEALEQADRHCDLIFVGHPNNPTGRLLPEETTEWLKRRSGSVIVDEAFIDFAPDEERRSLVKAAAESGHLLVIRSMTKFYSIPGLRLGYIVGAPDRIAALRRLQVPWSVNSPAQWIGCAVLSDREFAAKTLAWLAAERSWLTARLRELGLVVYESDANFLLLSLAPLGIGVKRLQEEMGRRGVLIRDASLFDGLDGSYCRLAVKQRADNERMLAVLGEAVSLLAAASGREAGQVRPERPVRPERSERPVRPERPASWLASRGEPGQGPAAEEAPACPPASEAASSAASPGLRADPLSARPGAAAASAPSPDASGHAVPGRVIMLQGTSSDVGKSLLAAALCRIFWQDGRSVAPFKSQNMSLNSYVTPDGKEIGRAQGMQADACRIPATTDMNPILLKPKKDMVSQVVVHGKPYRDLDARTYRERYLPHAESVVKEALARLRSTHDIVVIEGAGSPAEVNLKDRDIVNMRLAGWADAPVLLVADIDRGGVFASIVGTMDILTPEERERVRGFVINKFRGDASLLTPGIEWLERKTGKPVVGVIPYLPELGLEDEDSASLERKLAERARAGAGSGAYGTGSGPGSGFGGGFAAASEAGGRLDIAVIRLPRISNFTDVDPLAYEPDVSLRFVSSADELGRPDAVILPGSKNTVDDLLFLRESGLEAKLLAHVRQGGWLIGICAGYQMMGQRLLDPDGIESDKPELAGLGLFPAQTVFAGDKRTVIARGRTSLYQDDGAEQFVDGYEIHMGRTTFLEPVRHPFRLEAAGEGASAGAAGAPHPDGAVTEDGRVWGTYLHGILHNDDFRRAWLNRIRRAKGWGDRPAELRFRERREAAFDRLAAHVRQHLDLERVYEMMGINRCKP